jgi:hypothetical protein
MKPLPHLADAVGARLFRAPPAVQLAGGQLLLHGYAGHLGVHARHFRIYFRGLSSRRHLRPLLLLMLLMLRSV